MNISILDPTTDTHRSIPMSAAMQDHFNIPINHAHTILKQINDGMYSRWFKGKKDLVCMDFGANVGLVSLYMLPACKELHCIEPTPSHFRLLYGLLQSVIPMHSECNIQPLDYALSKDTGMVCFTTGHSTENKITSEDGYGNNKINVPGRPLSFFVNRASAPIDFCKIDIESGEMLALTEDELKKAHGKVKVFFVEVHPGFNGGMDENREELIKRFKAAGYYIEVIDFQTIVATA